MIMPMVPGFVFNYRRCYKEENSTIIKFMVEEAGEYETSLDLPLSRFAPLARYLVNDRELPLEIPASIVRSLKTTISLRQRCSAWYQQQYSTNPSPTLLLANQRHQYPISVLEEVLIIFEPHAAATKTANVGKQPAEAQEQQDMSIFEQLEIYSPKHTTLASTFKGAPSKFEEGVVSSTGGTLSLPPLTKAQKRSLGKASARHEDPHFAVDLLLLSLEPMRQFVREKWRSFQVDPSQLIVASIAMNTAIGFTQQIETEFLAEFLDYKDWEDVMSKLFSPTAEGRQGSTDTRYESVRTMDSDFVLPFENLRRFRGYLDQGRVGETSGDDEAFLNEHFLEIALLVSLNEQLPASDELSLGLRSVLSSRRKISLGIVFGLVVFLDIRHDLGENAARGFYRLVATTDVFEATKRSQAVCEGVIGGKKLSEDDLGNLTSNVNSIRSWIKSDRFNELRRSQGLGGELGTSKPFAFYKRNPLASGLTQLAVLLDMQRVGINHADFYGYVRPMAHFYNTLRCEKILTAVWLDMEDFIALHGEEYLIKKDDAEDLSAHLSRLCLAEGVSIEALATNPRQTSESAVKGDKGKARKIKSCIIMGALDDMLCPSEDLSAVITLDQVEAHLVERAKRKGSQDAEGDSLYAQWNKTHRLGPNQLLKVLEECLIEESPKLFFNYYTLHRICFSLLGNIEKLMDNEFLRWIPNPPGPKSNMHLNLPMLTHFIFEHDRQFKSGKQTMMKMAAEVMHKFLSKEGNDGQTKVLG